MHIYYINWGGVPSAVVAKDYKAATAFFTRICRTAPVEGMRSEPLPKIDNSVIQGWKRAAEVNGAVWATGLGALVGFNTAA